MPWGGAGAQVHTWGTGPARPTGALEAAQQPEVPGCKPWPLGPQRPGHRMGDPRERLAHVATPPDGPTYHLVHGDVLAVVIQPDGHLGCEAELPGWGVGKGVLGSLTSLLQPGPGPPAPGPPPVAPPEVDGLLLSRGGAVSTAHGLPGASRLYALGLPFLGAAGLDSGLRVSWVGGRDQAWAQAWPGGRRCGPSPPRPSLSPSAEASAGTMGLMPATRLVKKSLRKSRASCAGRSAGRSGSDSGAQRQRRSPGALPQPSPLTWSTLSRRGISETRRQHSGPPRLVVGATCSALMVSWGQRASSGCLLGLGPAPHRSPSQSCTCTCCSLS